MTESIISKLTKLNKNRQNKGSQINAAARRDGVRVLGRFPIEGVHSLTEKVDDPEAAYGK